METLTFDDALAEDTTIAEPSCLIEPIVTINDKIAALLEPTPPKKPTRRIDGFYDFTPSTLVYEWDDLSCEWIARSFETDPVANYALMMAMVSETQSKGLHLMLEFLATGTRLTLQGDGPEVVLVESAETPLDAICEGFLSWRALKP